MREGDNDDAVTPGPLYFFSRLTMTTLFIGLVSK
jgi:hypothetical protein